VNKQDIVELLKKNDKAVARAIVALNNRQTDSEQATEETRYRNGEGFRPCHARMGSSMAKFYQSRGYLTTKQIAYWRMLDRTGKMRIEIYAGQLLLVAQAKAAQPKPQMPTEQCGKAWAGAWARYDKTREELEAEPTGPAKANPYLGQDVGNLLEQRMVLEEQYYDLLESDDETLYGPVKVQMDLIDVAVKQQVEQAERAMQRREAAADREQTETDEHNKFLARMRMERS
jgi:hypothetical protein